MLPLLEEEINLLDQVQRQATKWVIGLEHKSYEDRLHILRLFSLSYRRMRNGLVMTHTHIEHTGTPPCEHVVRT